MAENIGEGVRPEAKKIRRFGSQEMGGGKLEKYPLGPRVKHRTVRYTPEGIKYRRVVRGKSSTGAEFEREERE